ncbi:hypothetical protein CAPTEDRAFT_201130 [Capitella teleta]|uniref:Uncharacterized protein n=1 Tax=Capitella teleta TaxID=283909 RepID=R7VB18_CAPTE|nr:hypothetical protein CAPTEDRAFT_201130 [Capitella teleta]|eukprot:ELU15712.1 hypothetical protein CAPTEDRAFT_201130 [Capitella teleta]
MAAPDTPSFSREELSSLFRKCIESNGCADLLSKEDVSTLQSQIDSEPHEIKDGICGYPGEPLYAQLAAIFHLWAETGQCPLNDLPSLELLDERSYVEERSHLIHAISPQMQRLKSSWRSFTERERVDLMLVILTTLGRRGLMDLLGLRKTVGSIDAWPPARSRLEETFNAKHKYILSERWSEGVVESTAIEMRLLLGGDTAQDNQESQNLKITPQHDQRILEVRQENGYGARWSADGRHFRGFLEPQMVDGHDVGWRH